MLPDKQCTSGPMPTGLFNQVADVLEPFLVELFNRSLSEGLVPSVFKAAYVTPLQIWIRLMLSPIGRFRICLYCLSFLSA